MTPYAPPTSIETDASGRLGDSSLRLFWRTAWWAFYLAPLFWFLSIYVVWALARIELGRKPMYARDDPGSLGGVTEFVCHRSWELLLLTILTMPLMTVMSAFPPFKRSWRWFSLITYVTMVALIVVCVRSASPTGIITWYFD